MPELWGGDTELPVSPLTLPVAVRLGTEVYTVAPVRGAQLAAWIAIGDWAAIVPGALAPADAARVRERIADIRDPLGALDCQDMGRALAARLCGLGPGLNGWRMGVRLCGSLVGEWTQVAAALLVHGIDPDSAPLWQTCGVLLRLMQEGTADEDQARLMARLKSPLPGEPVGRRSGVAAPPPFDRKAAVAAWRQRAASRSGAPKAIMPLS